LLPSKSGQKKYPLPPYHNKDFILSVQYNDNITKYHISYKPQKINLTDEEFFPESWAMPDKKTLCAVPEFGEPEKMGLELEVYLKYNKADGVLSLIGKYDYKYLKGLTKQNLYISDSNLKSYQNILNHDRRTHQSPFYLIKFELNKK
jgi:hypothetical protein